MKFIFLNLIFAPCIGFLCFSFIPAGHPLIFKILYITISVLLSIYFAKFFYIPESRKLRIRDLIPYFILTLSLIQAYFSRWEIQPYGMIDGAVLWMGKATNIMDRFLLGYEFLPNNPDWKFPSYPLGIPILYSIPSVFLEKHSLFIPQSFVILFTILLLYLCMRLSSGIKSLKSTFLYWIFVFAIFCDLQFLSVQSDLCADYPASFGLAIFVIFFLENRKDSNHLIMIGLLLGFLLSLKDEMMIEVMLILVSFLIYFIYFDRSYRKIGVILFHLSLTSFPIIINRLLMPVVPGAFSFSFLNSDDAFVVLLSRTSKILHYFYSYYIIDHKGLEIILTALLLYLGNRKVILIILVFWFSVFCYNFLFLFTRLNIDEHLLDAYVRIAHHLYLILPMVVLKKWRILSFLLQRILKSYFNRPIKL